MQEQFTHDERDEISRAFSSGNYDNAYFSTDLELALAARSYDTEHQRAAFVLGFFGSYSLDEIGSDREIFDECYFSAAGQYVVNVARYTDSRADEYAAEEGAF